MRKPNKLAQVAEILKAAIKQMDSGLEINNDVKLLVREPVFGSNSIKVVVKNSSFRKIHPVFIDHRNLSELFLKGMSSMDKTELENRFGSDDLKSIVPDIKTKPIWPFGRAVTRLDKFIGLTAKKSRIKAVFYIAGDEPKVPKFYSIEAEVIGEKL